MKDTQLMLYFHSFNLRGFKFAQTLIFAIEEINNSTRLLPGVSLGFSIYDSCSSIAQTILSSMSLMNGYKQTLSDTSCSSPPAVYAIVGESNSSPTIALASVVGPFSIPVVRTLNYLLLVIMLNQCMMKHRNMHHYKCFELK